MPDNGASRPSDSGQEAAQKESANSSVSLLVKIGAATFGTVIAPLIVAVALKKIDSEPAPAAPAAPTPEVTANAQAPSATSSAASSSTASSPKSASSTEPRTNKGKIKRRKNAAANDMADSSSAVPYRPLFNGRDLAGWTASDDRWSANLDNRSLVGVADLKKRGWIFTNEEYSNFRLRLEFRIAERTDSGIALRSPTDWKPIDRLEINLSTDQANVVAVGAILGVGTDADHPHTNPLSPVSFRPANEWNSLETAYRGQRLQVTINGQIAHDLQLDELDSRIKNFSPSGRIGLQCRKGRAEFRNIEIQDLPHPGKK